MKMLALNAFTHPDSDEKGNLVDVVKGQVIEVSENAAPMLINARLATDDLGLLDKPQPEPKPPLVSPPSAQPHKKK